MPTSHTPYDNTKIVLRTIRKCGNDDSPRMKVNDQDSRSEEDYKGMQRRVLKANEIIFLPRHSFPFISGMP